jgi:hypothetical protein
MACSLKIAPFCAIAEQVFPDRDANGRIQLAHYPDGAESQAQALERPTACS